MPGVAEDLGGGLTFRWRDVKSPRVDDDVRGFEGNVRVGRFIGRGDVATPQSGKPGYQLDLHFRGAPDVSSVS